MDDPDGGNEMHRICHSCVAKKVEAARGRWSSTKRKDEEGFLQQDASKKTKSSASKSRARFSFEQKLQTSIIVQHLYSSNNNIAHMTLSTVRSFMIITAVVQQS